MRDDHIQGILFDRPQKVDLAHYSRHERLRQRMLLTKHRLQGWLTRPQELSPMEPGSLTSYVVVRRGKHRQADLERLAARLKNHR